ncbi:MAG: DUF3604 domain-containing protein [Paraglaciecola sp.]|uniref:DUF3604 domain-containing protein n=1 Tax=Paraglaciecola sp. TaxID=1920173 RepID=UPI003296F3F1
MNITSKTTYLFSTLLLLFGCQDAKFSGDPFSPGKVTKATLPNAMITARIDRQHAAASALSIPQDKVILFGDTHVHSTYSLDAFQWSLPIMHGAEGASPPADACDYARFVSQLDFYFLTDHAESYTPRIWHDQVDSIRQCAQMSDKENPDVIPFIGFEWTQAGYTADTHYGHHNVLYKDLKDGEIPSRPIAAAGPATAMMRGEQGTVSKLIYLIDPINANYYAALNDFNKELQNTPDCLSNLTSKQQQADCFDTAATTQELYQKLDEWDLDTLVVPHGTTWGNYTPPGASWDHMLTADNFDADKTRLIEVYSGHGTSEEYVDWKYVDFDKEGNPICPQESDDYLPPCWQAGEIIRKRCLKEGVSPEQCELRAIDTRQAFLQELTVRAWWVVSGTNENDWLDAGQARSLETPAFNYRPKKSVQYGYALRNFDDENNPLRYIWGMISSTDTHSARPGHGFKQTNRHSSADTNGLKGAVLKSLLSKDKGDKNTSRVTELPDQNEHLAKVGYSIMENERLQSFFTTGGIAAVHAESRSRDGIWDAMKRKEVYATTGHRMLLWFDLLDTNENGDVDLVPMGSQVKKKTKPSFQVKAAGSFKQLPGCPEVVFQRLPKERAQKLSRGECYNPSTERYNLERIEIVRIMPQNYEGEPVENLIDNKWKVFDCHHKTTCEVSFSDDSFVKGERDVLYYARVYEEPIPTINGGNLRTKFNENNRAVSVNPCHGDFRTSLSDDCTEMVSQRAWSSPIFVDYKI